MIWLIPFSKAVLTGVAFLLIGLLYIRKYKRNTRYPPGPISLPLLGSVLQISRDPLRVLQKWAEKYGPIYSIKMGTEDTIVINDPKLVTELFSNPNSVGRPPNPILQLFGCGSGILQANGHIWEAQRRFTLRKLRDVGALKTSIERFLMEEATYLNNFLEKNVGKKISGTRFFNLPVVNALWRTVAGERYDLGSGVKPEILKSTEDLIEAANATVLSGLFFAPFLRHVAPSYFGWTKYVNCIDNFFGLTSKAIETHGRKLDSNNPRDFIDHYLIEMQKAKDPSSTFFKESGEKNLHAVVADLFFAGSETSSSTLSFATLYLTQNMEVQQKAQKELDTVVSSGCQVSLADKQSLPYTEAVMLETLRLSSIVTLGVPRQMLADTEFHGYFLPKGVTVISNVYAIHHDSNIWGDDVNNFRPERFLSEDRAQKLNALMPFSAGKRKCIGESLAKDTIFLFIANILQKFNIDPDPDCPVVDIKPLSGLPYTEAIVLETLRLSSIIAIGVPHRMLVDTVFHGHFLPKDVIIIFNLHAIHHDPKIGGQDANSFRPERFLSEDETRVISNEALVPFSTGRRQCIGDSLAKDTMFLFVASILQKFSILQDPETPVFNVETTFGMVVQPKPFNFVVKLRNGVNG
ncbi:Cytochrome P450 2J6 [Orchesella cincta]|uniref:Cytochrome P450 2J6 n=1 Tax=Orchesella cincta TaxID=48709 RepID=A0A1D2M8M3_ORCCI|nr:Cytochrome P450 2J6 [Orchesella cincta]